MSIAIPRRAMGARAPFLTVAAAMMAVAVVTSVVIASARVAVAGPPPATEPSARSSPSAYPADAKLTDSASIVKAVLRPAKLSAEPGGAVAFEVVFTVADGWHLYANGDTTFYGIALKGPEEGSETSKGKSARSGAAAQVLAELAVDYPAGRPADFFGTPVKLLEGRQVIRVRSTVAAGAKPGKIDVPLGLEVQACDDQRCLAPATIPLRLRLDVKRPG